MIFKSKRRICLFFSENSLPGPAIFTISTLFNFLSGWRVCLAETGQSWDSGRAQIRGERISGQYSPFKSGNGLLTPLVLKLDTCPAFDTGGIVMFYFFYFAYHIGYLDNLRRGIPPGEYQV